MVFNRKTDPNPRPFGVVERESAGEPPTIPLASNASQPANSEDSVIGKDVTIDGDSITIRCKGSLRVNGNIQADLHCKELVVGDQALIKGSIAADKVNIFGHINGAILGANVVLHSTAKVDGDIHSQYLQMEQGASFDGRSRKVNDPAEVAPQLEPDGANAAHQEADYDGSHAEHVNDGMHYQARG